jgi:inner membrane protein
MASFGHVALGLAAGRAFDDDPAISKKAMVLFGLFSLWPDLDVIGFAFGVHYGDSFGHRGATHSIIVCLIVAWIARLLAPRWNLSKNRTALFTALVGLQHPLLDTLTYGGGLGCALFWPLSVQRFWAPVRFIPIAPIGFGIFTEGGLYVMLVEVVMFSPFWLYALRSRRPKKTQV